MEKPVEAPFRIRVRLLHPWMEALSCSLQQHSWAENIFANYSTNASYAQCSTSSAARFVCRSFIHCIHWWNTILSKIPVSPVIQVFGSKHGPITLGKTSLRQSHAEAITELAAKALLDENIPLVEWGSQIQWRCGYPGFLRQTELSSRIDLHLKYGEPNRLYLGRQWVLQRTQKRTEYRVQHRRKTQKVKKHESQLIVQVIGDYRVISVSQWAVYLGYGGQATSKLWIRWLDCYNNLQFPFGLT